MSINVARRSALLGSLVAVMGMTLPASAADTVKVAAITRTVFYMPLWTAIHRGFMKDEGLDVQITFFDNAKGTNEKLLTGEVQFLLRSPEAAIMNAHRGGTMRLVAGGVSKLPHFIIANPRIKTLADLRGANFGVLAEREGTTYIVQDIAKAAGLAPGDYKISVVGGSPARWRLLQEGKIDVGLQPIPNSYVAEAAGFTNLGSAIKFVPEWQFTCVNVDKKWAEQNRHLVVKFIRGLQRGRDFMRNNPAEAAKIAAQELRTEVPLAVRMLADVEKYAMLAPDTSLNVTGLRKNFATLQKAGSVPADRPFDLDVFADLSYWRDAIDPGVTATTPSAPARK